MFKPEVDKKKYEKMVMYNFFPSQDVPGSNLIGDIVRDEEVFASSEVHCVGQPIGL